MHAAGKLPLCVQAQLPASFPCAYSVNAWGRWAGQLPQQEQQKAAAPATGGAFLFHGPVIVLTAHPRAHRCQRVCCLHAHHPEHCVKCHVSVGCNARSESRVACIYMLFLGLESMHR